jgi:hypothetical protein
MTIQDPNSMPDMVFRRLTGVTKSVFALMVSVLQAADLERRAHGGRPSALAAEQRVQMMLEYWREYRTYLHIGHSYRVSESAAYRNIRQCEEVLIKSRKFTLPGRKALITGNTQFEVVLIDVTETPIQRPKKSKGATTRGRKSATR